MATCQSQRPAHASAAGRTGSPTRPRAPTSSTPASCWPTRARCSRFDEHEVVLPVVVITELEGKRHHPELGYFARSALRHARRAAGRATAGSTSRSRSATTAARSGSSSTTPTPSSLPSGFRLGDNDTRILAVARNLANEGYAGHAGLQGPAAADQGLGGRPRRRGVPRRGDQRLRHRLDRHGRARRRPPPSSTSCTTTASLDLEAARDLPCHTGLVLLSERGTRAGPGRPRQAGAPGARRPRGVRHPRPLRRAADRARDAARPRGRHRLARRPGRHRQVGAGAVRRPRGGAWSAASTRRSWSSGRCSRSAARSSATCPARSREKMSPWAQAVFDTLGALTSARGDRRGPRPRACSRCCR